MTIEQKTIELQSVSPPLTRDQIIAELGKWQAEQSMQDTEGVLAEKETPEVVENQEPVEEEVVENEEVIEEEGNQEVVAEEQDATVTTTPDNASEEEDTESPSEDGSLESQEPEEEEESYEVIRKRFFDTVQKQKNETSRRNAIDTAVKEAYKDVNSDVEMVNSGEEVVDGDFTYRYQSEVDEDGNLDLQVFYKGKDDEEFINATERAKNNPKNVALQNQEAAIQSQLGFLPANVKEQANQQLQATGQAGAPSVQLTGEDMKKYVSQLSTVEKEALLAGRTEEEALATYNEMLEEYDMAGLLKGAQSYSVEDAQRKKELEDERKKIGVRDVKRVAQIDKELDALNKKYSISNILNTLSGQKYIDQELKRLAPDIKDQARKEAQLISFNPETGIGYKDGDFILKGKEIIEEQPITTYGGQVGSFKRSLGFEESKELNEQAELYRQAKVAYAKRNKIPLKEVTNEQVKEDVVKLYEVKLTEEAKFKLYEDEAEKGAGIFYGFKGVDDIIGDDDKEKFANLRGTYEKYLDGKTQRIFLQSQQSLLQKDIAKKIALSKTYETQEEIDEVNSFLERISIEQAADFKIYNKTLDEIAERANTSEDAELFANLQSRNYGVITDLFSSLGTSTLNLAQGVIEASARYGITDALLSKTPAAKAVIFKNIYDQLKGEETETIGRKIADFTGERVDFVNDFVNNEVAIPKSWDDLEGGMDVARYLARATGEQIPIYVTLAYTGGFGLPLIGLSTAGSKFREMQKEIDLGVKDYSILQMYSAATINGLSAVGTEYVTQGILGRLKTAYGANTGIKKGIREAFSDMGQSLFNWAADQAEEVPSELLDTFINNGVDRYVLGDKTVNMFDGFKDTAISTLWTSGIVMRAPLIGQQIVAPFRSKQSFQTIGENTSTINELQEIVKDPSTSARAKKSAADQINQLMVDNMKALKVDIDRIDQFKPGERKTLMDLKAQQYEVLRSIDATLADGTLSDSQKELEIKIANTQLKKLQTQSAKIIAPYVIAENKAKNEPIIQEAIEKVEQVTKKVLGESINVIDDMNNLPEGIPKFVDAYVDPKTNQIYINKEWAASVGAVTAAEHELLHKIQKSLFDTNPAKALELVEDFKKTLGKRELRLIEERLDANYRFKMDDKGNFILDKNGNKQKKEEIEYAEEYFNIFSDLVGKKEIGFTDNLGENLRRFLRKFKELVLKPAGFTNLEYQSGRDAYNFIKDYNKSIKKGKVSERAEALIRKGTTTTSDRTSTSITVNPAEQAAGYQVTKQASDFVKAVQDGLMTNEQLIETAKPETRATPEQRIAAQDALLEANWPVISKSIKFDPSGQIPQPFIKLAVQEMFRDTFPGRGVEAKFFDKFDPSLENKATTFIDSQLRNRIPEILERAKALQSEKQDLGIEKAGGVIAEKTTKEKVKPTAAKQLPSEVKMKPEFVENLGIEVKEGQTSEQAIQEALKTQVLDSFKETDINKYKDLKTPRSLAEFYAKMLGIESEAGIKALMIPNRNFPAGEKAAATRAKQFILDNLQAIHSRINTPGFKQTKVGKALLTKKGNLKPGSLKILKDIISGKNITVEGYDGKPYEFNPLENGKPVPLYRRSQPLKVVLSSYFKNNALEYLEGDAGKRAKLGAKFSITQAQRPGVYTAALGEQGVKVMRKAAEKFAKDNNIKVEFENPDGTKSELNVNNFKASNPKAVEYLKRNIENEMWKYIPLESLTRGTMIDYSSAGNAIFFNSEQFDNILKNAEKNRKAWLDQGNTLSYNVKEVNVAKAAKSPSVVSNRYSKPSAQKKVDDNYKGVKAILQGGANAIKADPANYLSLLAIYGTQSVSTSHLVRNMAVDKGVSEEYIKAKRDKSGKTVKEHVDPSNDMSSLMYTAQLYDDVDFLMPVIEKVYFQLGITETQDNKLVDTDGKYGESYNYKETQTQFFYDELKEYFKTGDVSKIPNALVRYFNPQVNRNSSGDGVQGLNSNNFYIMGKSVAEMFTRQLPKSDQNSNNIYVQNELTYKVMTGEITQAEAVKRLDAQISSGNAKVKPSITNNNMQPDNLKFSKTAAGNSVLVTDELNTLDKALAEGRKVDKPVKKIRVFDFDDTLARSKSNVLYTMPGESIVYNGSPKSFSELGERTGFIFLATEIKEAQEYANSNRGEVKPITVDNNKIATEENVIGIMEELGIATDEGLLYEMIDPRFEDFFIGKKNIDKVKESLKKNGYGGFKYEDGSQISSKGTESIAIIDKSIIKEPSKINATQFAEQAATLEEQGATFDFSQFEQVIDGKKGPLFNVAKKIADTRGTEDLFILTARPQSAAGPIKAFMKALGINIPLKNITGLANGTAAAKGRWIAGKAAEGYNDFYFADDASKNVKAVKDVLDQIDVKSRVQQAKFSKTKTFDTIVNQMIEDSSGIESYKTFSAAKARTVGRDKGRFDWLTMASSAEDFKGLLYSLLGNGKKGEAQYEFLKTNLIDPYNRAEDSITQAKIAAANDFMALKKQFPGLPKTLETETGVGRFTYQHALRTYMWTQQGMSIPGLSKADVKKLNKFITDDAKLQAFADQLISIQKGKPYPKPGKDWLAGNLTTDIIGGINKVNRKEYLQEWQENVDIIFSPENLNKMEAAYGTRWRKALENSLARMKAGTNRLGYNDQTSAVLDWVNNSVGAVMFLNTKSALLQTISAVNFINWGDNNIIAAGKAFANQKQFWGDFMTLMNSDYLVQRRNGLKINVSESEIADAVKNSKNKVNAAISYLLSKGFVLTRYADSFAIASGGATFYRNRMNKYIKEGMDPKLAQEQAFQDFRLVAEESQQSSSPDKISMQQASAAGRVILNWANTPMQYVRIQKRDLQDLIAGRGDPKVKMARIAYYGVIQNLIFNAMQQALFVIGFGDDEDDEEKSAAKKKQDNNRIARAANGMIDSQLKGLGIAGAGMVAVKNTLMKIYEESGKQRPEYEKAAIEALSFSPAISSKYRKIVGGLKSFSWNMKEMKEKGFSLDNPAYLAGAQIITAVTNIPVDRVIKKANNIRGILSEQSQKWQKVLLFGGWSTWDVGLRYYGGWDKPVEPTPAEIKRQAFDKMKKDTKTSDQVQMLLDLGLDKKQIKALRYEDARVKKIIELQNKKKDGKNKT